MFKIRRRTVTEALFITACIGLIIYFMPRDTKFNYHFNINTPWTYNQLIADFDFPIYKSEDKVKAQLDSLHRNLQPYFNKANTIAANALEQFKQDYEKNYNALINRQQYDVFCKRLTEVYKTGIISIEDIEKIKKDSITNIKIINNNIAESSETNKLNTIKSAYEQLIRNDTLPKETLRQLHLENYIYPNIIYDSVKTNLSLKEAKEMLSLSDGMVQKGQKIINRGELVDNKLYQTLQSYQYEWNKRNNENRNTIFILIGQFLLVAMAFAALLSYIYVYRPVYFKQQNKFILIFLLVTSFSITTGAMVMTHTGNVFMVPFAIVPILLCLFVDSRTAFMAHITQTFICSSMLSAPYIFILIQIAGGCAATFSLRELSTRSQLFRTVFIILAAHAIACFGIELISENDISKLNFGMYIYFLISGALLLSTYPLMFFIEKIFGFTSAVTFIELSNINNELLGKLSKEAPGTFQHSMQVGNLAAEAARRIGANSIEVRTGALYHDIGKLKNPIYFTENQSGGISPHTQLQPEESAKIILQHVKDGISLAESYHLPRSIKDFITTHHGTSKTGYFYITYKNAHPDEKIDDSIFTYDGPKPSTREQAILMMADSIEAASHSLKEYTESNIHMLVDKIIDSQLENGQFTSAPLTFKDITIIKETFKGRLKAIYHTRISYPEENKQQNPTSAKTENTNKEE